MTFAEFWQALPSGMKRGDKKRAEARWTRIHKEGHAVEFGHALALYCAEQKQKPWRGWMYAATFLGRWREMLEEREEMIEDEEPEYGDPATWFSRQTPEVRAAIEADAERQARENGILEEYLARRGKR